MGLIKNFLEKYKQKKEKIYEAEENLNISKKIEEKQKNANERELERYLEEERQKKISKQLEAFRKRKQNEMWHANTMKGNKGLLKSKKFLGNQNFKLASCRKAF